MCVRELLYILRAESSDQWCRKERGLRAWACDPARSRFKKVREVKNTLPGSPAEAYSLFLFWSLVFCNSTGCPYLLSFQHRRG